jgi:hypothetical protein
MGCWISILCEGDYEFQMLGGEFLGSQSEGGTVLFFVEGNEQHARHSIEKN